MISLTKDILYTAFCMIFFNLFGDPKSNELLPKITLILTYFVTTFSLLHISFPFAPLSALSLTTSNNGFCLLRVKMLHQN